MKYGCGKCGVPNRVCNKHYDCVADVWHAALRSVERRKTVRAKRPVQQRKGKTVRCSDDGAYAIGVSVFGLLMCGLAGVLFAMLWPERKT